jgi:Raf kinase inhibitor-like YbhB/YbcL family protein
MIKKTIYVVSVLALTVGLALSQDKGKGGGGAPKAPAVPGMGLSSPDFEDGGIIPDKFTQAAGPTAPSPRLVFANVPAATVSFVLIMHDPDNALNKGTGDVLHWIMFNIPGTAKGLDGNLPTTATLPDGSIQAKGIRSVGYMGPGNGAQNPYHHYTLELFALDSKLSLGPDASRDDVMKAMDGHTVGKAVLVGRFKRPN